MAVIVSLPPGAVSNMQLKTTAYMVAGGWQSPLPAELDGPQTLVLAFGASQFAHQPEPFAELAAAFPHSVVMGCSTAGEVHRGQVCDASITVAVARFAHTLLRHAVVCVEGPAESRAAGAALAAQLQGPDLVTVFVLSDGLRINGTALIDGLVGGLPAGVPVSGGLAGDGSRFAHTWLLDGGVPTAGRVCAVGLYGRRLVVGHGSSGGWSHFGPERRITRASGNVLYELDGKPALDLYKDYLGAMATGLPGSALRFPLSVRRREGCDDAVVRTILGIDEDKRAMTFAGDMPQGAVARLMRTRSEELIVSAGGAARQALAGLVQCRDSTAQAAPADPAAATLVVAISCVGRRLVLGVRVDEEIESVVESAPAGAAHVGFYSYGEIAPLASGATSELHNQTMTVTALAEI